MHQLMPTSLRPQPETHLLGLWYQTRNSPTSKQLILFIIPKYAQPWLRNIEIMNVIVQIYETYYAYDICYIDIVSYVVILTYPTRRSADLVLLKRQGSPSFPAPGQHFGQVRRLIQHRPHSGAHEHHEPLRNKTKWKKTKLSKLLTENEQSWHFNPFPTFNILQPSEASTCRWLNISAQPEPPQVPNPTGSQKQQHDAGNAAHLHDSRSPSGIDANVGDRHAKIVDQPFFWRPGSMQWWVLMARWKTRHGSLTDQGNMELWKQRVFSVPKEGIGPFHGWWRSETPNNFLVLKLNSFEEFAFGTDQKLFGSFCSTKSTIR